MDKDRTESSIMFRSFPGRRNKWLIYTEGMKDGKANTNERGHLTTNSAGDVKLEIHNTGFKQKLMPQRVLGCFYRYCIKQVVGLYEQVDKFKNREETA